MEFKPRFSSWTLLTIEIKIFQAFFNHLLDELVERSAAFWKNLKQQIQFIFESMTTIIGKQVIFKIK